MQGILASELAKKINNNELDGVIVDVREVDEFANRSIKDSVNMPLSNIGNSIDELKNYSKIYLICESGMRSRYVQGFLKTHNINTIDVIGGIQNI
jgi:rhodanese-related sulfurtransferase